ncbi:MAG: M1 family metallopeptidase [Schleiferiaceae bacterium]
MKIRFSLSIAAVSALVFTACNQETVAPAAAPQPTKVVVEADTSVRAELFEDPHSYSREESKVTHLNWEAAVDFEKEIITANAVWTLEEGHGDTVIFDIKDLQVNEVLVDGSRALFTIEGDDPLLGSALVVPAPGAQTISILYKTSPEAEALQWYPAELTQGKRQPFLFTQSQAILARTWVPCQDRPGVRFTYEATVKVPKEVLALMSASNPTQKNDEGIYEFSMPQPIPSYLLALGVGDLAFIPLGERSGVYAEPEMVRNAAYEFAQTEDMIADAEEMYGPYYWGRYDMLVLPPSFPFGGMENPRLTFLTPTVVVGDMSLVSLIAHELAHSWSGNLVTNATWNDFWINEGFTVYFEMRIMEKLYGVDFADMLEALSYDDLQKELTVMLEENVEATSLKQDLKGKNPDDGVNAIAYDKGFHFLRLCENTVGREKWDEFLTYYFDKYKFKTMVTEVFLQELAGLMTQEQWDEIGVEQWVYGTGLPVNCPFPASNRFVVVDDAVTMMLNVDPDAADARSMAYLTQETTIRWTTQEWLRYIRGLEAGGATEGHYALADGNYGFSGSPNPEIVAAWYSAILKTGFEGYDNDIYTKKVESFLGSVGRRKFIVPMYQSMLEGDEKRQAWAKKIYMDSRASYHPLAQGTLDALFAEQM